MCTSAAARICREAACSVQIQPSEIITWLWHKAASTASLKVLKENGAKGNAAFRQAAKLLLQKQRNAFTWTQSCHI